MIYGGPEWLKNNLFDPEYKDETYYKDGFGIWSSSRFEHLEISEQTSAEIEFEQAIDLYGKTQNILYVLTAYKTCRKYKAIPPDWMLDWISRGFERYVEAIQLNKACSTCDHAKTCAHRDQCKIDIGHHLGLPTESKRGQLPNSIKRALYFERDSYARNIMTMLIDTFDFDREAAAQLTCARNIQLQGQFPLVGAMTAEAMLEEYRKKGGWKDDPTNIFPARDISELVDFLSTFQGLDKLLTPEVNRSFKVRLLTLLRMANDRVNLEPVANSSEQD